MKPPFFNGEMATYESVEAALNAGYKRLTGRDFTAQQVRSAAAASARREEGDA
ncbi:hypothetical protein LCM08_20805 [Salipiger pacificus]|uniref:hypothetical protein n=1 Tax=Alloyangia pacifica TaxID=311180 RepID=UPI001CD581CA|nr:hypothetical protein [Alloyangia pacifica]